MSKFLNNKIVLATGMMALVGLVAVTGQVAFAQSGANQQREGFAQKLATKFNLDSKEVQQFFDENQQDNEAKREERVKGRLDQAVKNGKLTADQEKLLLDKRKELKSFKNSLKGKSSEERKTAITNKKAAIKKWLKDKDISEEYLKILHLGGQKGAKNHIKGSTDTTKNNY